MNGNDIFKGLKYVGDDLVEEAEFGKFPKRAAKTTYKKPFFAAALIAMMLLLTGCAVVYMLKMQNLKIGDQAATKPVFETNGMDIAGYEDINQQVLTVAGLKGSNGYQAALEWYNFKQEYDPDHSIIVGLMAENKVPEYPAEYDAYNIYSQEMKDKLDSILHTYNLKPMGARLVFRTTDNFIAGLGIEDFFVDGNGATVQNKGGACYENGNFYLNLDAKLPKDKDSEVTLTSGVLCWNQKDCFSEETFTIEDTGDWQEWNYTTASGYNVLIMRSPSDWKGWIICDRGDAIIATWITTRNDYGNNDGEKTWWDHQYMTDRQIEMVADAIDFGIQPRKVTQEDVENQPVIPNEPTQDGYTVELKSIVADGYRAYFVLGITAPEEVVISHDPREGHEGEPYRIEFGEHYFVPVYGQTRSGGHTLKPLEDSDGLDNTQDFYLEAVYDMMDGSKSFSSGTEWKLGFADLVHYYWDENGDYVEETIADGEWYFEIPILETDGDFREIELVPEPLLVHASIGWKPDGTDVYGDVEIESLTLRSLSATIMTSEEKPGDLTPNADTKIFVVMKDGSRVDLQPDRYAGRVSMLYTLSPIDVAQVDYVLLPDGTKIPAPEFPSS